VSRHWSPCIREILLSGAGGRGYESLHTPPTYWQCSVKLYDVNSHITHSPHIFATRILPVAKISSCGSWDSHEPKPYLKYKEILDRFIPPLWHGCKVTCKWLQVTCLMGYLSEMELCRLWNLTLALQLGLVIHTPGLWLQENGNISTLSCVTIRFITFTMSHSHCNRAIDTLSESRVWHCCQLVYSG